MKNLTTEDTENTERYVNSPSSGGAEELELQRDEAYNEISRIFSLGIKVSDCLYDKTPKSARLLEAEFKARHLQELCRSAWDLVEQIENEEEGK